MTRLTANIWISAYLRRLQLVNIPAFVVTKGDETAGAVLIKLNTLDGQAVAYQRSFDLMTGARHLGDAGRWRRGRGRRSPCPPARL